MWFDEPTMGLDPIMAAQVLDLVMRARDVNQISSIYVTKKIHEISYLSDYKAIKEGSDNITIRENGHDSRIIVLDAGQIVFDGTVAEFYSSRLPGVAKLLVLEQNDHYAGFILSEPARATGLHPS